MTTKPCKSGKVSYATIAEAFRVLGHFRKRRNGARPYRCPICGTIHVGTDRRGMRLRRQREREWEREAEEVA
jgi:hypothetical protein